MISSGALAAASSKPGSAHNAPAVTAAARGFMSVAAASANAHNASVGSSSPMGSHPGPGTTNAAASTGTSAAASAETARISSKEEPEKGAATASREAGSNIGRNAAATPASTSRGATSRNGASAAAPGGPARPPAGRPAKIQPYLTAAASPATTVSTPATDSSQDLRSDGVAASRRSRWSGAPQRHSR